MNKTNGIPKDAVLAPFMMRVTRRMVWRHTVPWLLRGIAAGIAAAALVLLSAHLWPWPHAAWWAAGIGLLCAITGGLTALLTRPSMGAALRRADHLLGLRDRLTTAWEYHRRGDSDSVPILRLQRDDLLAAVEKTDLRASLPVRLRRYDALAPAIGTLLLVVAIALPHTAPRTQASQNTTHARITHAAQRIEQAQRTAGTLPPATLNALPKSQRLQQAQINRILSRLQRELAAARTPAQALKAIARAQDALNRLSNPRAGAQRAALSGLAAALRNAASAAAAVNALSSRNPAAISSAMRKLAGNLPHMSASQRASLAHSLQNAAHAASSDAALSQSLQNASTALAQGDTSGAQVALQAAGQQAAADAASTAQQDQINSANSALDNARNDIAGLDRNATGQNAGTRTGSGKPGRRGGTAGNAGTGTNGQTGKNNGTGQAGTGQGQGTRKGAGQGSGTGQGKGNGNGQGKGKGTGRGQGSGNGQGSGQGSGSGQGAGNGQGQGSGQGSGSGSGGSGGSGGQGRGGGRGGNSNGGNNGNTTAGRVFIPAPEGQGQSTTTQGSKAAPTSGSLRPWTSVLPQYEQSARSAIENNQVPPGQKALVKQYFDRLSH